MGGADPNFIGAAASRIRAGSAGLGPALALSGQAGAVRSGLVYVYEQPVTQVLWSRLWVTLLLMVGSLSAAFVFGVALGGIRGAARLFADRQYHLDAGAGLLRHAVILPSACR